jgi:hypothetical protein
MLRFWSMKTLQKVCSVHASVQNRFNEERHVPHADELAHLNQK